MNFHLTIQTFFLRNAKFPTLNIPNFWTDGITRYKTQNSNLFSHCNSNLYLSILPFFQIIQNLHLINHNSEFFLRIVILHFAILTFSPSEFWVNFAKKFMSQKNKFRKINTYQLGLSNWLIAFKGFVYIIYVCVCCVYLYVYKYTHIQYILYM